MCQGSLDKYTLIINAHVTLVSTVLQDVMWPSSVASLISPLSHHTMVSTCTDPVLTRYFVQSRKNPTL